MFFPMFFWETNESGTYWDLLKNVTPFPRGPGRPSGVVGSGTPTKWGFRLLKKIGGAFWFLINFSFFQSSFRFRKVSSISDPFSGSPLFLGGKTIPKTPWWSFPVLPHLRWGRVGWPPVKIYQCHALSFCFNKQPLPEKAMTSTAILVALYISRMISPFGWEEGPFFDFFSFFSGSNLTVAHDARLWVLRSKITLLPGFRSTERFRFHLGPKNDWQVITEACFFHIDFCVLPCLKAFFKPCHLSWSPQICQICKPSGPHGMDSHSGVSRTTNEQKMVQDLTDHNTSRV